MKLLLDSTEHHNLMISRHVKVFMGCILYLLCFLRASQQKLLKMEIITISVVTNHHQHLLCSRFTAV